MENWHEHIDDYMNGSLKGGLLQAFEKELAINTSLQAGVANYEDAKKISEGLLEIDVMHTLDRLEKSYDPTKNHSLNQTSHSHDSGHLSQSAVPKSKSSIFKLRTLLSVAAAIGVVVFAGWWSLTSMEDSKQRENLLAQIEKLTDDDATKSIDTVGFNPFQKGKYFYSLNRFEEGIKWLEKAAEVEKDKSQKSEIYFWIGDAYLRIWKVDKAKVALEKSDEDEARAYLKILAHE